MSPNVYRDFEELHGRVADLERQLTEEKSRADSNFRSCERIKDKLSECHNARKQAEADNVRLRAALEQTPCRCRHEPRCPKCVAVLVEGQDQYAGSWICPVCITEVSESAMPIAQKCPRCAALAGEPQTPPEGGKGDGV